MLYLETILRKDDLEFAEKMFDLEIKELPNHIAISENQKIFDEREKEYNSRLVKDGTISATNWLKNRKEGK